MVDTYLDVLVFGAVALIIYYTIQNFRVYTKISSEIIKKVYICLIIVGFLFMAYSGLHIYIDYIGLMSSSIESDIDHIFIFASTFMLVLMAKYSQEFVKQFAFK